MKVRDLLLAFSIISILLLFSGCLGGEERTSLTTKTTSRRVEEKEEFEIPLADIITTKEQPESYILKYDWTMLVEGKEDRLKQTIYVKGEKGRADWEFPRHGEDTDFRTYTLPTGAYICTRPQGDWTCYRSRIIDESLREKQQEMEMLTPAGQINLLESEFKGSRYDGTQRIVGVVANCYKLISHLDEVTRICLHPKESFALLYETDSVKINPQKKSGSLIEREYTKMIATQLDLVPPADQVFELPGEPVDVSDELHFNFFRP